MEIQRRPEYCQAVPHPTKMMKNIYQSQAKAEAESKTNTHTLTAVTHIYQMNARTDSYIFQSETAS